jgi:hypothetical protein
MNTNERKFLMTGIIIGMAVSVAIFAAALFVSSLIFV